MWTRCSFIVEMLADEVQYDEHWALFGKAIHLSAAILSNTNKTIRIGGCCCCCSSNDLTQEKWSLQTGNFIKKRHYTFTHTHKTTNKKKQFPVSDGEKNVDNDIGDWRSASQRVIIICTKTGRRNFSREKNLGYGQWHKWREWRAHQITIFFPFFFSFNYHCLGSI